MVPNRERSTSTGNPDTGSAGRNRQPSGKFGELPQTSVCRKANETGADRRDPPSDTSLIPTFTAKVGGCGTSGRRPVPDWSAGD